MGKGIKYQFFNLLGVEMVFLFKMFFKKKEFIRFVVIYMTSFDIFQVSVTKETRQCITVLDKKTGNMTELIVFFSFIFK